MDARAGIGIAVSILTFAALPMLLVVLAGLISRRQFRARWGSRRFVRGATSHPCSTAGITVLPASAVDVSAHPVRSDALKATRDGQLAYIAAGVVYGAIIFGSVVAQSPMPHPAAIAAAYAMLAPPLLITLWSLRVSYRRAMVIYVLCGAAVLMVVSDQPLRTGLWASVIALLMIPALVFLFGRRLEPYAFQITGASTAGLCVISLASADASLRIAVFSLAVTAVLLIPVVVGSLLAWLQDRGVLTRQMLHVHLAWLALTVYFEAWALLNTSIFIVPGIAVFALACWLVALHWLLFRLRASRPRTAAKRLLLLRRYTAMDTHEDLLDDLRDSWQRVGTIELFVGPDVHTRTLRPRAMLLGRARRTDETGLEADARYPLNAIDSFGNEWRARFPQLENEADVVLMDLRCFDAAKHSCRDELRYLIAHRDMRRTVFLVDGSTDFAAVESILQGATIEALDYTDRCDDDRRALFDLLLGAAYAS